MATRTAAVSVEETGTNGTGPVLHLEDIIAAQDTIYDTVATPEWGGDVRIASLTGTERQKLVKAMRADEKAEGEDIALIKFMFRVVAASMVDERGHHLPEQETAIARLAEKNVEPVQRIFDRARKLSGLGQQELDRRVDDLKASTESPPSGTG